MLTSRPLMTWKTATVLLVAMFFCAFPVRSDAYWPNVPDITKLEEFDNNPYAYVTIQLTPSNKREFIDRLVEKKNFLSGIRLKFNGKITTDDLVAIGRISTLTSLSLLSNEVGELRAVKNLRLRELEISAPLTARNLQFIGSIESLSHLSLHHALSDREILYINGFGKLFSLHLTLKPGPAPTAAEFLRRNFGLYSVSLSGHLDEQVLHSFEGMLAERGCPSELSFENSDLDDTSILSLTELQNVEKLNLANTRLSDASCASISRLFPRVRELNLANTRLSGSTVEQLNWEEIRSLNVENCPISKAGYAKILTAAVNPDIGYGIYPEIKPLKKLALRFEPLGPAPALRTRVWRSWRDGDHVDEHVFRREGSKLVAERGSWPFQIDAKWADRLRELVLDNRNEASLDRYNISPNQIRQKWCDCLRLNTKFGRSSEYLAITPDLRQFETALYNWSQPKLNAVSESTVEYGDEPALHIEGSLLFAWSLPLNVSYGTERWRTFDPEAGKIFSKLAGSALGVTWDGLEPEQKLWKCIEARDICPYLLSSVLGEKIAEPGKASSD